MARRLYANNARCRLGADISTTDSITEIVLETGFGSLFPLPSSGNFFILTITDALFETECFLIDGRVGDILSVAGRAQEGTIAKTFTANDPLVFVGLNPTRGSFERLEDHIEALLEAHDAAAIGYGGASSLSADDVAEALDELDAEKANLSGAAFSGAVTVQAATSANNPARLSQVQGGAATFAIAAGTGNAITASTIELSDPNTVVDPTFNLNGTGSKTIVKGAESPLEIGDLIGDGYRAEFSYNSGLDKWVLLNPATGVEAFWRGADYVVSTSAPGGGDGNNGDFWFRYNA
jgi:hypothetical protein